MMGSKWLHTHTPKGRYAAAFVICTLKSSMASHQPLLFFKAKIICMWFVCDSVIYISCNLNKQGVIFFSPDVL